MQTYSLSGKRVWVVGHKGMVGNAISRRLMNENCELLRVDREELDLRCQEAVEKWLKKNQPEAVFLAAAKVGGIYANNNYPAEFLYDNLMIESNIIHASWRMGIEKLLFLGSSCIYPRECPQPIKEEYLLTGLLEPTNEWYAIAKIAGLKLCQAYRRQHNCNFISVMPTNLYGPGDNFHAENSHVPAALLRRFHEAKIGHKEEVVIWGSGNPRREFLYVDDLAYACIFLMKNYSSDIPINVGIGKDITIAEFANLVSKVVEFNGKLIFDQTRPDGMLRKVLDISRLSELGWTAPTTLKEGLNKYYQWYLENYGQLKS